MISQTASSPKMILTLIHIKAGTLFLLEWHHHLTRNPTIIHCSKI